MSSEDYKFIALLVSIRTNIYKYSGPIAMGLGSMSCIISLLVFTKKTLRKNPCCIYFVAYNISNLLLIFISILLSTLPNGYDIDPSLYNLSFCHFRFYTILVFDVLSPTYLILASIDRVLITSRNALTRQRSTLRLAYMTITITTLFWVLFHSHALVLTNIITVAPGLTLCYYQSGLYTTLVEFYSIIIKGMIIPLMMIVLGLWAVRNIRKVAHVKPVNAVSPAGTASIINAHTDRSKDRQLLRIVLIEITTYIIFNLMTLFVLTYLQIKRGQKNSLTQAQLFTFLIKVGGFSGYIATCISSYINLLASKIFRSEVKKIFSRQ